MLERSRRQPWLIACGVVWTQNCWVTPWGRQGTGVVAIGLRVTLFLLLDLAGCADNTSPILRGWRVSPAVAGFADVGEGLRFAGLGFAFALGLVLGFAGRAFFVVAGCGSGGRRWRGRAAAHGLEHGLKLFGQLADFVGHGLDALRVHAG